jgi:hypothetical protein
MLESLGIDENIGLFMAQLLSSSDQHVWEFKNKRIVGYEQLQIFILKFFKEYLGINNDRNNKLISLGYVLVMKYVRGELERKDIEEFLNEIENMEPNNTMLD